MSTYSSLLSHRSMNFDAVRNPVYQQAIQAMVTPDSVVLDLGAGLGLLGFMAAKAGARKVYMVEPEPVIEVTRKVARANGFDNVECIQATAETLELPEKADIIISVFTGNFLLTEDLLPSLFYARDHFLAPGGQLLPDNARMMVAPVTASEYYQEHVHNWSLPQALSHGIESYGVNYQAVRSFSANSMYYDTAEKFGATLLAEPACLLNMDFMSATEADCDDTAELTVNTDGECHGWLGWFDMCLNRQWLSTSPKAGPTHWRQVFMPLDQPIAVKAGQKLGFHLKRPAFGEWSWATDFEGQQQRQSTFLSEPVTPDLLHKKSDAFQPSLNTKGQAAAYVLSHFDGSISSGALADDLLQGFAEIFPDRKAALRFVKNLTQKYG